MKPFGMVIKYIIVPCSSVVGIIYSFHLYFLSTASSVVEPTKIRVDMIQESSKIHQERVERELTMARSEISEIKTILIKATR